MDTIFVIMRPDGTPFHRDDAMGILATDSEAQAIRFQHAREDEGAEYVRYTRAQPPSAASVSERAREILSLHASINVDRVTTVQALAALEQALTQPLEISGDQVVLIGYKNASGEDCSAFLTASRIGQLLALTQQQEKP